MTKKERIIQEAVNLFAEEGFESTSIQTLAAKAEVAQGLLYRHFRNKEDLLLFLIREGMSQVMHSLSPYTDDRLDFRTAFAKHIDLSFQYLEEHTKLWRVLHQVRQKGKLFNELSNGNDPFKQIVQVLAKRLKKEGYRQPQMLAWTLFSLVDGIAGLYLLAPDKYPLRQMRQYLKRQTAVYVNK
jgi:AcrR family transcriptional regulator